MAKYLAALFAVLFPFCSMAKDAPETFEGTVKQDGMFMHKMQDGNSFLLVPVEGGWRIAVSSTSKDSCTTSDYDCNDLAAVTEPILGISMREVLGWQFLNTSVRSPKNVLGRTFSLDRTFDFVTSRKDLDTVMAEQKCRSDDKPDCADIGAVPVRGGVLTISGYKPAPGTDQQSMTLKSLNFKVTIYSPVPISQQLRP